MTDTNPKIRLLELPRLIDGENEGWVFDTLKSVLSVSIRAMQPLFPQSLSGLCKDKNFMNFRGSNTSQPATLLKLIVSGCDTAEINYSQLILENFTKSNTRLAIVQDEYLSQKIFTLLLKIPSFAWSNPGTVEQELSKLRPVAWHLPQEWEEWKDAIECLRNEAKYRLQGFSRGRMTSFSEALSKKRTWQREPFTDAGVKFVERDEHFWWANPKDFGYPEDFDFCSLPGAHTQPSNAGPSRDEDQAKAENPRKPRILGMREKAESTWGLTDEKIKENNKDWRDELFESTPEEDEILAKVENRRLQRIIEIKKKYAQSSKGPTEDELKEDNRGWRDELFIWSPGGNASR